MAALDFATKVLSDQPEGAQVVVQVLSPTEENNGALVYRRVLSPVEGEEPAAAR